MDLIADKSSMPDMASIENYIADKARPLWRSLTAHIEASYGARPQISYSVCAAQPGWNVKYKKSGKALCTLYPEKQGFIALVVLGAADMPRFEATHPLYTPYVGGLFEQAKPFNGTKWLMIRIENESVLEDIKRLLALKTAKP